MLALDEKCETAHCGNDGFQSSRPSMTLDDFRQELLALHEDAKLVEFTQKNLLHGTPHVFSGREADYYSFKLRLCKEFGITHTEIFIVGSAKLGFSPHKGTNFTLDSDIDVAIVSSELFDQTAELTANLEFKIRSQITFLQQHQWKGYHKYLRHLVIGWMRPDLLPYLDPCAEFKDRWFSFFDSVSYGRTEVGNYKVTAGVFRSHRELERYSCDSVSKTRSTLLVGSKE